LTTGVLAIASFAVGFVGINTTYTDKGKSNTKGAFGMAYAMPYELAGSYVAGVPTIMTGYKTGASTMFKDADAKKLVKEIEKYEKKTAKTDYEKKAVSTQVNDLNATLKSLRKIVKNGALNTGVPEASRKEIVKTLDDYIESLSGMQTISLTVLFTYISLILVMGLVPAVVGTKKLICALGKCDCCGKEPVKASSAPVAYSAPVAPATPAPAPKATKTK